MKKVFVPALMLTAYWCVIITLGFMQIIPNKGSAILFFLAIDFLILLFILKSIKRKYYNNDITFKEVFTNGIIIGVFTTVIASAFVFIYLSYLNPSAMEVVSKTTEEAMQKQIETRGSEVSAEFDKAKKYITPAFQALFNLLYIFYWTIYSLIISAIIKNRKPDSEIVA